jgi:adenylate cyclase class 2
MKDQELEVKFYISNLPGLQQEMERLGARLVQERVHEVNLRFDTPAGDLKRNFQVLRLRRDRISRLTYKGPSQTQEGVRVRQEIEITVSDFDAARAFLEALGYRVAMMYEKYRATYELERVEVSLDELPYGNFAELEGPDPARIQEVNHILGLDWNARAPDSYTALFDHLCSVRGFNFSDLSFENFKEIEVLPEELGVFPADRGN